MFEHCERALYVSTPYEFLIIQNMQMLQSNIMYMYCAYTVPDDVEELETDLIASMP